MAKVAVEASAGAHASENPRSRFAKTLRHHGVIYLFLLPAIGFFAVFSVYPILYSFVMSFTNWPLIGKPQWVGVQNYVQVLSDPVIRTAFLNALLYMVISVPLQIVFGLLVALGLDRPLPGRTTLRLIYYLPVITSWVVVTYLFEYLFNTDYGMINWVLMSLHLIHSPIPWLADPTMAIVVAAVLGTWKGIGWAMMIFLAALQAVPDELHEAAALDGAGRWRRLRFVTLPSIRASLFFVAVLLVMGALQVFIQIFILTAGGPANESQVPLVYMYQQAFSYLNFSYAGALSWLITVLIVALTLVQFLVFRPKSLNVKEA
ncbi:MAG: sugar ABC transporter permease [Alicyclobacillus sp.]|nr:sugar ABC transporter permease [Alicyclobacillus sp.]